MTGGVGFPSQVWGEYGETEGSTERIIIKEYSGNLGNLEMALHWHKYLIKQGVRSVPGLTPAKNGDTVIRYENRIFYAYLNPGGIPFTGEERKHLRLVTGELARIHKLANDFTAENVKKEVQSELKALQAILLDLIKYAYLLRDGRTKNDFERIFLESVDTLYDQGQEALQQIIVARGFGPEESCMPLVGDFRHANLVMLQEHPIFLNPIHGHKGSTILEFVHFINSYLPQHGWNSELLRDLLHEYGRVKSLSHREKHLIKALLLFPTRFWLYANQYFRGEKTVEELQSKMKNYLADHRRREYCLTNLASWLEGDE